MGVGFAENVEKRKELTMRISKKENKLSIYNSNETIVVTLEQDEDGRIHVVCDPTGKVPVLYTVEDAWPHQVMTGTGGITIDLESQCRK
jgi:hypothetical protein